MSRYDEYYPSYPEFDNLIDSYHFDTLYFDMSLYEEYADDTYIEIHELVDNFNNNHKFFKFKFDDTYGTDKIYIDKNYVGKYYDDIWDEEETDFTSYSNGEEPNSYDSEFEESFDDDYYGNDDDYDDYVYTNVDKNVDETIRKTIENEAKDVQFFINELMETGVFELD